MTSPDPATTPQPDFTALLADIATHAQQADGLLGAATQTRILTTSDEIQASIAHSLYGLLRVAEAMTADHAADLAASATAEPLTDTATHDAPRTTARVRVFHNYNFRDGVRGHQPGHRMTEVYAYDETDLGPEDDDMVLLERAFELFNVGDDPDRGEPDTRALVYRERGNRSLSVGDVVAVDQRYYACDPFGWRELEDLSIQQQQTDGTTPLY